MAETKEKSYDFTLTPAKLPPRTKYKDIIDQFEESGEESVLIEGPITEAVKPDTLVASLTQARKGRPISVRRKGDQVYLERKPLKK